MSAQMSAHLIKIISLLEAWDKRFSKSRGWGVEGAFGTHIELCNVVKELALNNPWSVHSSHCSRRNFGVKKTSIKIVCAATWRMSIQSFWCIEQKDLLGNFWGMEFFQFWFITLCWRHSGLYFHFLRCKVLLNNN